MIVYQLACGSGHFFEGWFASSQACDQQAAAGQLQCPTCSSAQVRKLPAAPYVKGSPEGTRVVAADDAARHRAGALQALRHIIMGNTEDVGRKFAEIARRIHYREEKPRGIRGQATAQEAAELHDEGIPAVVVSAEVMPSGEIH